jgi:hypothetical protein
LTINGENIHEKEKSEKVFPITSLLSADRQATRSVHVKILPVWPSSRQKHNGRIQVEDVGENTMDSICKTSIDLIALDSTVDKNETQINTKSAMVE